jgi:hypothetical protein
MRTDDKLENKVQELGGKAKERLDLNVVQVLPALDMHIAATKPEGIDWIWTGLRPGPMSWGVVPDVGSSTAPAEPTVAIPAEL